MAQARQAAGRADEQVDIDRPCSVQDLIVGLASRHGDPLRRLLLDDRGSVQPALLLFVGDEQVDPAGAVPLRDGDVVTVLSPMAGG
jgi:molybdopterin converting factor small subunit